MESSEVENDIAAPFEELIDDDNEISKDECDDNVNVDNSESNLFHVTANENSEISCFDNYQPIQESFTSNLESGETTINEEESSSKPIMKACDIAERDREVFPTSPATGIPPLLNPSNQRSENETETLVKVSVMKECEMEKERGVPPNSPATGISPLLSPSSSQRSENENEALVKASVTKECEIVEGESEVPPNSPATSMSSVFSENETLGSASEKATLPYFHLPKPDFEEYLDYLSQKDEFLVNKNERKSLPLSSSYPIDIDAGIAEFSAKEPHQLQHTLSNCNNEVTSLTFPLRTSISREYCKAISRNGETDKTSSPGLKHLALKELLKKQINEKKCAAFNRSKEIRNLDEYEEVESDDSGSENRDKNLTFQDDSDRETSDEDIEEPTVYFSLEHEKSNVENEDSDESDEDISILKKNPRTLEISDDDDSVLPEITTRFVPDIEQKSLVENEADFEREDIASYQPFDEDSLTGSEEAGSPHSLASETCKSFESDKNSAESNLSSVVPTLPMDDPPILLTKNRSAMENIFLSQDLAAVCSGSFSSKADGRQTSLLDEEKQISEEFEESSVKEKFGINDFLDLEAELSGEDDGDDDPDSEGEGIDDLIAVDQELPSNTELRDEIAGLHLKHLIDDDEEILKEYKEKFLDDGELHTDGRTRRFAWKNAGDIEDTKKDDCSSSESEDEIPDLHVDLEKAKWREENKEEKSIDNLFPSSRPSMKLEILGRPKIGEAEENSSRRIVCKRPRGSYLHLDTDDLVFKKLKAEEEYSGSRVTKHCLFADDDTVKAIKDIPKKSAFVYPTVTRNISASESIFDKM